MADTAPSQADDVRRWIAEILLLGVPEEVIAAQLVRRGWKAETASAEVRRAVESPYLQGATLLQQRVAKRDWILSSIGRLAAIDASNVVDRADTLAAESFFRDYYAANRPVI